MALIRILGNYVLKSLFYVKKFTDLKKEAILPQVRQVAIFGQNMHIIEKL